VASEWSVVFTAPGTGKRLINRGSEWYVLRDSLILEVRAYLIPPAGANVELATSRTGSAGTGRPRQAPPLQARPANTATSPKVTERQQLPG
jgi:hypothetical protein